MLYSPEKVPTDLCPSGIHPIKLINLIPSHKTQAILELLPPAGAWNESLCMSPLRTAFWSPAALHLSQTKSLLFFKSRCYEDSSSWHKIPRLGSLVWGSDISLLMEELHVWDIPPVFELSYHGYWTWTDHVSAPPTYLIVASSLCPKLYEFCLVSLPGFLFQQWLFYI